MLISDKFKDFYQSWTLNRWCCQAYHDQSDRQVEAMHKFIKLTMKCFDTNADVNLVFIVDQINIHVTRTTKSCYSTAQHTYQRSNAENEVNANKPWLWWIPLWGIKSKTRQLLRTLIFQTIHFSCRVCSHGSIWRQWTMDPWNSRRRGWCQPEWQRHYHQKE